MGDKLAKKLIAKFKKRKKNSTTLARTTNEQWILWALPWKPNNVQSLKHFASRGNWNPTSMNWKSLLTMPTRPTVKDKRLSNATKVPLEIPSKATKMKHALDNRSWNKSEFPKEKPMHSVERSKNPELFWILPKEPRDNLTLHWLMPPDWPMSSALNKITPMLKAEVREA